MLASVLALSAESLAWPVFCGRRSRPARPVVSRRRKTGITYQPALSTENSDVLSRPVIAVKGPTGVDEVGCDDQTFYFAAILSLLVTAHSPKHLTDTHLVTIIFVIHQEQEKNRHQVDLLAE